MSFDLYFYWKLLLRRFPVMLLLITLCSGLGVYTALRLPETFTTAARLLVEEPQIPQSMAASTVQTQAIEQLDIIQQRLMTRANLIDIANKHNVYSDLREVEPDEIVQRMTAATRIVRSGGDDQATLMTIGFEGESARIVSDVVNEYVTLVLESNADFRTTRVENTLEFFEEEADRLGEELDAQSVKISTFKSANSDALPEDQGYRLGRQTLLQERMALLEKDLRAAEKQKEDIERIFQTTGRIGQPNRQQRRSPEEEQLIAAQAELDFARGTYSDSNPRIIRLQSTVDRLEAVVAAQSAANFGSEDTETISPEEAMFEATMVEMDNRISSLRAEIDRAGAEVESLQVAISASSANGITINTLEREYEAIQSRYDAAVRNLNEARMSERIETTAQGQRITVIEFANVPDQPSGPNRPQIAAIGGVFGFALASAYFILLELLNRTVRRPAELVSRFNVTPITTIPYLESTGKKFMRRTGMIVATITAVVGVLAALWYIDTNYMPLDLLVQRVLARLGIA